MAANLSKALLKLSSNVECAETTPSQYYTIGCIKVRVSDHIASNMTCDLVIFYNGKSTYTVIPNIGTYKEVQWFTSVKDVIEFIIQFEKMARILIKPFTQIEKTFTPTCYEVWKQKFHTMYACKKAPLAKYLDRLFQLYQKDQVVINMVAKTGKLKADKKLLVFKKLLGES